MPGHLFLMTRSPFSPCFTGSPFSSTTSASIPGMGRPLVPGFIGRSINPGRWLIIIPPVSVIHQVEPTGHLFSPTTSKSHLQAEGLMGSPTLCMIRRELLSCFRTKSSPNLICILVAVGVV